MPLSKGRECAESCIDYLALQLVQHYQTQRQGPALQVAVALLAWRYLAAPVVHWNDPRNRPIPSFAPRPAAAFAAASPAFPAPGWGPPHPSASPFSPHCAIRQAALDAVGERVGRQLAERYCRDRPPLTEALEVMKWLCKEFWGEVFRKGVDNLRTNHRRVHAEGKAGHQGRGVAGRLC